MPTATAIVRPFPVGGLGLAAELDVGLRLVEGLKCRVEELRLGRSTDGSKTADEEVAVGGGAAVEDDGMLIDGEEDGKGVGVGVTRPGVDPRENKFTAPTPEQQVPLKIESVEPILSQHINPPSAAHLFEQLQTGTPPLLKSSAFLPVYSSLFFSKETAVSIFHSIRKREGKKKPNEEMD